MSVYRVQQLIESLQKDLARGEYLPDQEILITIWTEDDAVGNEWIDNPRRWTEFCRDFRLWHDVALANCQSDLLNEWLSDPPNTRDEM